MEKMLFYYHILTEILAKIILGFASLIVGLNVASLFVEAVSRYLLGSSRAFMEEFPRLMVPFIIFPMMGVLLKAGKHIHVELLPQKLKGQKKSVLMIVVYSIVLVVAVQFFSAGTAAVLYFKMMGLTSITEWPFPMWWVYVTFPLGFALLIIFDLELLLQEAWSLYGARQKKRHHRSQGEAVL